MPFQVVKKPLDLSKIGYKLTEGDYSDLHELRADIELLCTNAIDVHGQVSKI